MTDAPTFLTVEEVVEIHRQQLAAYGGTDGLRDPGALESAVMVPQASMFGAYLHADLFEMAAAYAFHLAEAQAFLDGNKRTAVVAALVFLDFNGIEILDPDERLYDAVLAVAAHRCDKAGLAALLRSLPHKPPPDAA